MPKKPSPIKARIRKMKSDVRLRSSSYLVGKARLDRLVQYRRMNGDGSAIDLLRAGYSVMELIKAGYPKKRVIEDFRVKTFWDKPKSK